MIPWKGFCLRSPIHSVASIPLVLVCAHSVCAKTDDGLSGFADNVGATFGVVALAYFIALLIAFKIYRSTAMPKELRDALRKKQVENEVQIEEETHVEQSQQEPKMRKTLPQAVASKHDFNYSPSSESRPAMQPSFRSRNFARNPVRSQKDMTGSSKPTTGVARQRSGRNAVKPKPQLHRSPNSSRKGIERSNSSRKHIKRSNSSRKDIETLKGPSSQQVKSKGSSVSSQERKQDVNTGRNHDGRLGETFNPIHSSRRKDSS